MNSELLLLLSRKNFQLRRYSFGRFDLVQLSAIPTGIVKNLATVLGKLGENSLYCQY